MWGPVKRNHLYSAAAASAAASDLHPLSSPFFFLFSLFFFASCTRVTILSLACDFPQKSIIRGDMVPGEEVRWPLKQWEDALVSWYQGQPVVSSIESTLKTPSSSIRIMLIVTAAAAAAACVASDQCSHMYEEQETSEASVITCLSPMQWHSFALITDLCWQRAICRASHRHRPREKRASP